MPISSFWISYSFSEEIGFESKTYLIIQNGGASSDSELVYRYFVKLLLIWKVINSVNTVKFVYLVQSNKKLCSFIGKIQTMAAIALNCNNIGRP